MWSQSIAVGCDAQIVDVRLVECLGFVRLALRNCTRKVGIVVITEDIPHLLFESAGTVAPVSMVFVGHGGIMTMFALFSNLLSCNIHPKLGMDSAATFGIWHKPR